MTRAASPDPEVRAGKMSQRRPAEQRRASLAADAAETFPGPPKARGDVPAERACLCCGERFWSEGFSERICRTCKSKKTWRSAVSIPGARG